MSIGELINLDKTEEVMDALPDRSIIIDRTGDTYVKREGLWYRRKFGGQADRDALEVSADYIRSWSPAYILRSGRGSLITHTCNEPPLPPPPLLDFKVKFHEDDVKQDTLLLNGDPIAQRWEIPGALWHALTMPRMRISGLIGASGEKITMSNNSFTIQLPKAGQS